MEKKIVPVSGQIIGDCLAIGITPMGLLVVYSGPVIESAMPPSMAEIVADALVARGSSGGMVPNPNSAAGRN